MPIPEDEFRNRLRQVTSEFAYLLKHPDRIETAPSSAWVKMEVKGPGAEDDPEDEVRHA